MKLRVWTLLALQSLSVGAPAMDGHLGSSRSTDNSSKKAIRVTVSFNHVKDAERYVVTMGMGHANPQKGCNYFDPTVADSFVDLHDSIEIPNQSKDFMQAVFDVYTDQSKRSLCDWSVLSPLLQIRDTYKRATAFSHWDNPPWTPGAKYIEACAFDYRKEFGACYAKHPHRIFPHNRMVTFTVQVSEVPIPLSRLAIGQRYDSMRMISRAISPQPRFFRSICEPSDAFLFKAREVAFSIGKLPLPYPQAMFTLFEPCNYRRH